MIEADRWRVKTRGDFGEGFPLTRPLMLHSPSQKEKAHITEPYIHLPTHHDLIMGIELFGPPPVFQRDVRPL